MASITIQGARKAYDGVEAVRGVDIDVADGELFVLLGPSGCGKTTLLRAIAGLESLDSGQITLDGGVVSGDGVHVESARRGVGLVFQDLALWPHLTALQHLLFVLGGKGESERTRARESLEEARIGHLADRRPEALSGGEQQRLALARSLVTRPGMLLLDEPLSSLDPVTAAEMRSVITELNRSRGITMVFVTHQQAEAFELADRIAVMRDGVIEQCDRPEVVHDRPTTSFVATFVGSGRLVGGSLRNGQLVTPLGSFPCDGNDETRLLVRESDVRCGDGGESAVVKASYYRGGRWATVAEIGGAEVVGVDDRRRDIGAAVGVTFDGDAWFVDGASGAPGGSR